MFYDDEYPDEAYDRDRHDAEIAEQQAMEADYEREMMEARDRELEAAYERDREMEYVREREMNDPPLLVDDTCGGMVVPNESVLATDYSAQASLYQADLDKYGPAPMKVVPFTVPDKEEDR